MKKTILIIQVFVFHVLFSSFQKQEEKTYPLTVKVMDLRNSKGVVQFALYNTEDSFPDEHYKKYFRKLTAKIANGVSTVTFENLPVGRYAVNILHDEDGDGEIKKGLLLPKEGIGFSNFQSLKITNRPTFKKAAFDFSRESGMEVKIIYL
ncbi:MAG TPA: DUF2141 domain-containing protein [Bacteroidia bacterium]|nr:DUF2141 domain-containing protein [Bacteroidia bacterium]